MKSIAIDRIGKDQDKFLKSIKPGQEIWCTEQKLESILVSLFPGKDVISNKNWKEIKEKFNFCFRPDFRIPELKLIIEFQGYKHFTDTTVIYRDIVKSVLCEEIKYKFIELPYFVQPTIEVLKCLYSSKIFHLKD